ncbi:tetratricopeptide repeat protein [Azospirillum brasilense]|uniref:tetratricopeptide repeat protein n=1 Tax=Azospirillum brasilense TaxID=192 RepID=UPI001555D05C|nr:tetratricopeptide repeat protein [Azospirillum brasilense]
MVTLRDALAAAVGHHQAGRLDAARPLYHSILRSQPGHPDALHLLGVLESQSGRPRAAERKSGVAGGRGDRGGRGMWINDAKRTEGERGQPALVGCRGFQGRV